MAMDAGCTTVCAILPGSNRNAHQPPPSYPKIAAANGFATAEEFDPLLLLSPDAVCGGGSDYLNIVSAPLISAASTASECR